MTIEAHLSDVIYNAAEQSFEGVVTINTGRGPLRYAASYSAPITTDFEAAADGLIARAHRMHELNRGMRASHIRRIEVPTLRKPSRPAAPTRWLDSLLSSARAA